MKNKCKPKKILEPRKDRNRFNPSPWWNLIHNHNPLVKNSSVSLFFRLNHSILIFNFFSLQDDLLLAKLTLSEEESLVSKLTRISQPANQASSSKREKSKLSLLKFERRAEHVKNYCENVLTAKDLNEYESPTLGTKNTRKRGFRSCFLRLLGLMELG